MCVPTLNTAHRKVILACGVQPSGVYSNDVKCYFALSMAFKNELFLVILVHFSKLLHVPIAIFLPLKLLMNQSRFALRNLKKINPVKLHCSELTRTRVFNLRLENTDPSSRRYKGGSSGKTSTS